MAFCEECGSRIPDGAAKCPACGASVPAGQPQAPVHDQQSNSYARQSAPSYRPAPGDRVDNLVLAENEKIVRQYQCSNVKQPRCVGYLTVTNKRVLFQGKAATSRIAKEVVLDQEPDMIVGWGSLFAEDALGPVSEWNDRGVGTYLMNNTVSGLGNRTVEFLYDDIETLGQIFDVEDAAQAMIDDMKTRIAAIGEKVSALPDEQRVRVVTVQYVYENEFLGRGGTDFNRALTELAGGIQVNDNGEQSMEVLIDLDPDVLVILDLSSSPAQEKIDAIKANPTLQNIKAVQNDRFVVLDHAAFYCGGPRTVEAIETLAAAFYPDLFSA